MTPQELRNLLQHSISDVTDNANLYVSSPNHDFSRNRKLPLKKMISILLSMEGKSLNGELLNFFQCSENTASSSAFVQQRNKLSFHALETLFQTFTASAMKTQESLYQGYRLLAADGTDIHIATNAHDPDSFVCNHTDTPYNLLHLTALYDVLAKVYVDASLQKYRQMNEKRALNEMVDHSEITQPVIVLADRGFESYNVLAHMQEKGWNFLVRIKDFGTHKTGILHGFDLPHTDEFDISMDIQLTRKQTNEAKELLKDKNNYKRIKSNRDFDYLPVKNRKHEPVKTYRLKFRIVRFALTESTYEVLLTNLDPETFSSEELKKLYKMRWGIETSFRELKYTVGMLHFHSKKVEFVYQEIFARLIMYNFSALITSHVIIKKKTYRYTINFSIAVHVCREFFLERIPPSNVEAIISRHLNPVRSNRCLPRKSTVKTPVSFTYRVA